MIVNRKWYCKETDRAEVILWSLVTLAVQLLVLELGHALLACLLVLLAMDLLAVNAAVFHEEAGVAVLELDRVIGSLAAVGAGFFRVCRGRRDRDATNHDSDTAMAINHAASGSVNTTSQSPRRFRQ